MLLWIGLLRRIFWMLVLCVVVCVFELWIEVVGSRFAGLAFVVVYLPFDLVWGFDCLF